jgi:hypothetical protein
MFASDLTFGKKYEKLTTELFESKRFEIAEGNFKDYDVKLVYDSPEGEEVTVTFECKGDRISKNTKAIAVEFQYAGEPSGIEVTKADYWIHFVDGTNKYYLIPTRDLRRLIRRKQYFDVKAAGDGLRSKIYIIDDEKIAQYADVYSV